MMLVRAKTRSPSISISVPRAPRLTAYRPAPSTFVAHVSRRRHSSAPNRSPSLAQLRNAAFVLPVDRFAIALRQITRSVQFWPRVLLIWGSFKLTQISVTLQRKYRKESWEREMWDKRHNSAGDMMLRLCTDLKGFYVKAGQLIALQAFVPTIIRAKLGRLHDDMPPMSPTIAKDVIEQELRKLGHSLSVFSNLDFANVIGSASIAQVHNGVLANGKRVAVKVQYPNIEPMMMSDLANFALLGSILERTELKFDLTRVVQELKKQIAMEFDFEAEARNMNEIKHALRSIKSVTVPQSVPGLVSRRLLVMDYVDGTPMTQLESLLGKLSRRRIKFVGKRIMEHLTTSYGKMILSDGFFQADCHPGNILVTNSKVDIGLLDYGQTKRFSEQRRVGFVRLVDAMARKDSAVIIKQLKNVGIVIKKTGRPPLHGTSKLSVEEKLAYTMFDTARVPGVSDNPFALDSALQEGEVENIPKDLVFLLRTIQIMKGICRSTFNTDFSVVSSWKSLARSELKKRPLM